MFRKRDTEAAPTFEGGEPARGPAPSEPARRRLDLPMPPSGSSQVGPPPQVHVPPPSRPEPGGGGTTAFDSGATGKRLIVGRGIRLSGEITACDRLVVEGHVEVTLNETKALEIKPSGRFIGSCEVEEAEISGTYEGELTVRGRLIIRTSGQITGKIRYGELELERGGRIAGELAVYDTAARSVAPMAGESRRTGSAA